MTVISRIKNIISCQHGATAIEYTLMAAGIAVAISATVFLFGDTLFELYNRLTGILP